MAGEPELKLGDSNEWVTYLQQLLFDNGTDPGGVDGTFSDATEAAVKQAQSSAGLPADGVVGQATWDALTHTASPEPAGALGFLDETLGAES
jgi:peptidoglycan hydrolase-like protein with peptidoglycan-binding domain